MWPFKTKSTTLKLKSLRKPLDFMSVNLASSIMANRSFKSFKEDGFGSNPYVYMVVDKIAKTLSLLDVELFNGENEVTSGEVYDLLNNPWHNLTFEEFKYTITVELLINGNCFLRKIKPAGFDKTMKVQPLRTEQLEVEIDNVTNLPMYYIYTDFGKREKIMPEEIIQLNFPNVIDKDKYQYFGTSPLRTAAMIYMSSNDIFEAESYIMKNRGVVGMLSNWTDTPILPKERERIQEDFDKEIGGPDKFNKIKISNNKLNYLRLGMSPSDLKLIETSVNKLRIICGIYGVGSELFGDKESSTYNNITEIKKSFYSDTVLPLNKKIIDTLNRNLIKEDLKSKEELRLDESKIEVLKYVNKDLSAKVIKEYEAGIITQQEARNELGYEGQGPIPLQPSTETEQ